MYGGYGNQLCALLITLTGLKGRAVGVCRAIGLSGTYRDASRIATVLICVIYAVLYVALDTLDVLGCIAVTLVIKLVIFHFNTSFHSFATWQYYC